jgi:hypothetical protein
MRAQHMPKTSDYSRPAGMNMPVPVDVIWAAAARLLVAHDAQDAPKISLQHLNNYHPDAIAEHSLNGEVAYR